MRPTGKLAADATSWRPANPRGRRCRALGAPRRAWTEASQAVLAAVPGDRDRLLLRTLWATGARLGEVLALRPRDIHRTRLTLPDISDPHGPTTSIQLTGLHTDLATELRRWARANALGDDEPLFFSRERGEDGRRKAIDRVRAWQIVTAATRRTFGRDEARVSASPDSRRSPTSPRRSHSSNRASARSWPRSGRPTWARHWFARAWCLAPGWWRASTGCRGTR